MADPLSLPLLSVDEAAAESAAAAPEPVLRLASRELDLQRRVAIMGIVNNTPDSFYDRGATYGEDAAVDHARELIEQGAAIVDIGGVKGGPGPSVDPEEERHRVEPVVRRIREEHDDVVLSVDTFRATVADAVLGAGADLINDVTGGSDPDLLDVVAAHGAGYVAMHHGGRPRTRPFRRGYRPDVTTAVIEHCRRLTDAALERGVAREALIVDPGHDFQKTTYHSLELSRRLPELAALGFPVLVALSNKDFVGETLDRPIDQRVDGSLAATVFSILRGARIVRVHEVARTLDAVRMTEALLGWRGPAVTARGLE